MNQPPPSKCLPPELIERLIRQAFAEDLGDRGDLTTRAVIPEQAQASTLIKARQRGVLAGFDLARAAFHRCDPAISFTPQKTDGDALEPGDCLAEIFGPARGILTAERVALNFLSHLSGIASETRKFVEAVRPHKAEICCTRKTTPGLRALEKYAVRMGGGSNHRFGLYDAVLIKDNHIAIAGGVKSALEKAVKNTPQGIDIEIEIDNLDQLAEALNAGAKNILLDNMPPETLKKAVALIAGRASCEASGGVSLENAGTIAATGVERIAVGWITHSAPSLDIGLDFEN